MSGYCWTEGIIITILQICPKNHSPWASFFLPRRIDAMATGRQQLATGQLGSGTTEKSTPMEMAAIQGKAKALTALEQFTEVKISLICILYFVFLYTFFCIIVFCSMLSCCRYLHFTLPHSPPPRVGWATLPSHSLDNPWHCRLPHKWCCTKCTSWWEMSKVAWSPVKNFRIVYKSFQKTWWVYLSISPFWGQMFLKKL